MKTFEEAIRLFVQPITDRADAPMRLEAMATDAQRYADVARQVFDNDDAKVFICTFVKPNSPDALKNTLLNVFINGVIVGMEMERQELKADARSTKK